MGTVKILLPLYQADFDTNINEYGETLLMLSIQSQILDIINLLISSGSNVNLQNDIGDTALIYSCITGNKSIVEALLKNDANPSIRNRAGNTILKIVFFKSFNCPEIRKLISDYYILTDRIFKHLFLTLPLCDRIIDMLSPIEHRFQDFCQKMNSVNFADKFIGSVCPFDTIPHMILLLDLIWEVLVSQIFFDNLKLIQSMGIMTI